MERYIIGIDSGTTGIKAVLFERRLARTHLHRAQALPAHRGMPHARGLSLIHI